MIHLLGLAAVIAFFFLLAVACWAVPSRIMTGDWWDWARWRR